MKVIFYSLQGLGNSIINFPILHQLRRHHDVRVISFNNGSSAFFGAFHSDSIGVGSRTELLKIAKGERADAAFTCYPTWRRELSASLLTRAQNKCLAGPAANPWARFFWKYKVWGDPKLHHLENNLRLLEGFPEVEAKPVFLNEALAVPTVPRGKILGIHPTASTPVKYFPLKFWKELLTASLSEYDEIQIFSGTHPAELEFCAQIRNAVSSPKISHLPGLNFRDLTAAIGSTLQFIGTDSALMHLAALMGKKVLGLWSFANFRVIYPYGDHVQVYMPDETLLSTVHEYPKDVPAYLQRADAGRALEILRGDVPVRFTMKPRFAKEVRVYTY